jgi:hypothetical protein
MAKQFPDRTIMDISKLKPFGLRCYIHQKKERRDRDHSGKSDKKAQAKIAILVGYDDQKGPLRFKVFYPNLASSEWVADELVTFDNPLEAIQKTKTGIVAEELEEKPLDNFLPLIGTRHVDPDNGLQYETTEVKINRQGYIVAYRRWFHRGKMIEVILS